MSYHPLYSHPSDLPAADIWAASRIAASDPQSRTPTYADVFGPVMSNGTRFLEPRKNVGAIGDRRKKDDVPRSHMANVQDNVDPDSVVRPPYVLRSSPHCSQFTVTQLLRTLEYPCVPEGLIRQPHVQRPVPVPLALEESPSGSSSSSSPGMLDMLQTPSDSSPLMHRPPNAYRDKPGHAAYSGQFAGRSTSLDAGSFKGFRTEFSNSIYDPHMASNRLFPALDKPSPQPLYNQFPSPSTYQGSFNPFGTDTNPALGHMRLRSEPPALENTTSAWPPPVPSINDKPRPPLSQNPSFTSPSASYYGSIPAMPRRTSGESVHAANLMSPLEQKAAPPFSSAGLHHHHQDLQRHQPQQQQHVAQPTPGVEGHTVRHAPREKQPRVPGPVDDRSAQPSPVYHGTTHHSDMSSAERLANEPINFLHLLSPTAVPPYSHFINRIIKNSDQQASIFLQQKLKIADTAERKKIIDAVAQRGVEMMTNRFGNWAVQRCLEPPCELSDRMKIVQCMRGHIVELATNCYGTHVLQKALDCEEDIRLMVVSELLLGDPSSTLLNKHSAHVWSKIMELTWTPPAPPIFAYVNKSLAGKWASLACHETGSLVVQTAFEQCEDGDKELIIGELLDEEAFTEVVTNAWGNFCVLHLLEHGAPHHQAKAIDNLIKGLSQYASHEQSIKSVLKALKEGGADVLDRVVLRLCEPPKGGRRASLVDISLSPIGSQLVGTILPNVNKEQRSALYEAIRGHVVTLRGSRVGSKVIWLFDRMRAYYGY
ncbi:hypothetical protein M422DRAFT_241548 [Sphaerobolus stellatus SS14]|nr:hypothetical protein M422DRAFT_241548 [Sphaerobolus stellatus SS14]